MITKLAKSKTVIFGAVIASLGVLEQNINVIPEEYRGFSLVAIGISTIWLRLLTTEAVSEK